MIAAKAKPRRADGASKAISREYLNAHRELYGDRGGQSKLRAGIGTLLSRLESVRETSAGRWIAKCAAHEDRSPSLSVRELPDGRILIHCFAGCEVGDVLAAVGLEFRDLYPEPLPGARGEGYAPERRGIHPMDALRCISTETRIVAIVASDLAERKPVSQADADRVATAAGRISAALEAVGGAR